MCFISTLIGWVSGCRVEIQFKESTLYTSESIRKLLITFSENTGEATYNSWKESTICV